IVATHGRGFWVVDDISALRKLTPAVLASRAHLFKPSDLDFDVQGGDNGTPFQKDEPQAPNPLEGVVIDYYLKSAASSPVTLEILDAAGTVVRKLSSDDVPPTPRGRRRVAGGIPNVSPLWQTAFEPLSAGAGMHRVAWVPVAGEIERGFSGFGGPVVPLTGTFTARLTVNGAQY